MRLVVTGGAGFIGRVVVRQAVARGDQVVAITRDPRAPSALALAGPSVEVVAPDPSDPAALAGVMRGAEGLIHAAGTYEVGIPTSERPAMFDSNVRLTERVLDAGIAAGVPRMVHLSTINAFGNTGGKVVDETFRRDPGAGFTSYYDETKWLGQLVAEERAAAGAPISIVNPGTVYGPGDHSGIGQQLLQAYLGTAPFIALGGVGISPVHVVDLAVGILAALDRGRPGRTYILGGPYLRLAEAMAISARAGGQGRPRIRIPDLPLRVGAFLAPNAGGLFGIAPNLREIVSASIGVTYWASSARAATELGYVTRDLPSGFADAFGSVALTRSPA